MLAIEQARRIETILSGQNCLWPDADLVESALEWGDLIARLEAGDQIDIGIEMGSRRRGDIAARVFLKNGILWCRSEGDLGWQRYDGLARDCRVPYGTGGWSRRYAVVWEVYRCAKTGCALQLHF